MDTLRGSFGSSDFDGEDRDDYYADDDSVREPPPAAIGNDERRMQVRAYNHWASLLEDRNFPSIEDLEPANLPDFGPHSVLLDFTAGIDDPLVLYIGNELAGECGADGKIEKLSDVPARSLLSRITDHYMQILANQAPIGFEAEFVNQRGATILYRGILLPFSSDDDTIDFIYGVINWKELADQLTTDELMLEIDQALDPDDENEDAGEEVREPDPVTEWADGPVTETAGIAEFPQDADVGESEPATVFPAPAFGAAEDDEVVDWGNESWENEPEDDVDDDRVDWSRLEKLSPKPTAKKPIVFDDAPVAFEDGEAAPAAYIANGGYAEEDDYPEEQFAQDDAPLPAVTVADDESLDLYDCLAAARELAQAARSSEDRSRAALYAAVGRAYDVSLAAEAEPEHFEELVAENGLTVQDRAPMTPVVKLVFGADYDKTRLTEYAAVLSHAHRLGVERGALAGFLSKAEGGLKGVVTEERRLRREESGKPAREAERPSEALARKLRELEPCSFDSLDPDGAEFGLVMIRRLPDGEIVVLGEVPEDVKLVERAGRALLG